MFIAFVFVLFLMLLEIMELMELMVWADGNFGVVGFERKVRVWEMLMFLTV